MGDPYGLERFVEAQEATYDAALAELRGGAKTGHWMWFIFPQARGLGASPMSQRYAISSLDEARAYLRHPLLGRRLRECAEAVNGVEGRTIEAILGRPDDMKFHSSMTLFARADPGEKTFEAALARWFAGRPDERTVELTGGDAEGANPAADHES